MRFLACYCLLSHVPTTWTSVARCCMVKSTGHEVHCISWERLWPHTAARSWTTGSSWNWRNMAIRINRTQECCDLLRHIETCQNTFMMHILASSLNLFLFFWAFYLLYFSSWTLVAARYFQLAMFLALLMALFLPDMWVILNQADNSVLDVLLTLVRKGNVGNVGNGNVPVFSKTKMSKTNSVGKQ